MSELEVEAVESVDDAAVPEGIDAPDVVLYGGKGGVGKTTMAAATALASARDGTPTLVISTDPAHSLSDAYGRDVPAEPGRVHEDVPLYGVEIDPDAALEEAGLFGTDGQPLGGVGEMLGGDDLGEMLAGGAMPGADEAAAIRLLLTYLDDERFDRVVVDTAPTGHTLRLLELPEMLDSMVGRMLKVRQRLSGMMDSLKGLFGGADEADVQAGMADLEALAERIEYLRDLLADPVRTDFRIVMVPEEMSVFESKRLRAQLREYDVPVGAVVVNRVMEDLADVADVGDGRFVSPNVEGCEFCRRRWKVQQKALTEAQELFAGHEVRRVPLFADEVRGEEMLKVVAACIE